MGLFNNIDNKKSLDEEERIECIIECNSFFIENPMPKEMIEIKYSLPLIHSYVADVKKSVYLKLKQKQGIKIYKADSPILTRMDLSRRLTGGDWAREEGYSGQGIGIAVLDTGISPIADFTVPENRILAFKDFVNKNSKPYDDNGHGTHVAGIAAGNGYYSDGKYAGMAPKANLVVAKILDENGQGNSVQALNGIQWIIDNRVKYNIRVVNLSIGTNDRSVNMPLLRAVNTAWEMGMVMISAAGNTDMKRGVVNAPGISRKIITVGTYDQRPFYTRNLFGMPVYTTSNQWADVYAPGTDIVSCLSPDYSFRSKSRAQMKVMDEHYIKMSGTSMATPMVSGAAALLLEKNSNLTPNQIKMILRQGTVKNKNGVYETGLLNIESFI